MRSDFTEVYPKKSLLYVSLYSSRQRFSIFVLTMVFTRFKHRGTAYIAYLVQDISSKTRVSAATIYRLKQTKIGRPKHWTRTPVKHPSGRPKKLTSQDERHLLQCIPVFREEEGHFCAKRLM